ncbi:gamma-glutamylcyclotransferase family protein [Methylococcus sp. ANG]|uniref:gamma-glutamylcyclotransferase family protein n=1 Tax=Methylococcus sp. ANG TaxID=3231903 RepID=UPI003459A098
MEVSLFAYGTLQLPEVMAAVAGRAFDAVSAWLPGHARYRLRRRVYPGLRREAGAITPGTLFLGLGPRDLARLDRFEDAFYTRTEVTVSTAALGCQAAQVYLIPPRSEHLLVYRGWSLDDFIRAHGPAYVRRCRRQFR